METHQNTSQDRENPGSKISPQVLGWGFAALVFAIIFIIDSRSPLVLGASFVGKFFGVLGGTFLGLIGALVGDAIRKFVMPDAVYTSGGFFQLFMTKVFWKIGPQTIGMALGVIFGVGIVLR